MCGGHRRKPASEENDEEEDTNASASGDTNGNPQAFMLSSLKPANGKFVLGPPVDTTPPVVVFTGPADHPDPVVQTASAPAKPKKKKAAVAADKPASDKKTADKPKKKKAKVTAAQQK